MRAARARLEASRRRPARQGRPQPLALHAAWDSVPASLAHGILDDETYDWWEVAKAMRETGGEAVVADEAPIERALDLVRAHTGVRASATGTAGLAGVLAAPMRGGAAAVMSGVERGADG